MPYTIEKNLIPGLDQQPYDGGAGNYVGVLAHSTANNGDNADGERHYESTTWQNAFVHFFVDDVKILQVADTAFVAYGAGHIANHAGYVQVELCQSADLVKFNNAYARYTWLLAHILYERKLGVTDGNTLMSHAQVSAKWKESTHSDPIEYLASHGKSWANVVTDVIAEYVKLQVEAASIVPVPLPITATQGTLIVTTKAGLNLRQMPNASANAIAVIPYNTTCNVIGMVDSWFEVQHAGGVGWLFSQYVTFSFPVPVVAPVPVPVPIAPVPPIIVMPVILKPIPVPIIPIPVPASILADPANLLVLKQTYVILDKIFGGNV